MVCKAKALDQKQFALVGLNDLSNAFSNMKFDSITISCREHNVDDTTSSWIDAMPKIRVALSCLGHQNSSTCADKGCHQGDVPPPLLYILVKDSLLKRLKNLQYFSTSFADDLSGILVRLHSKLLKAGADTTDTR